jgi:hypothetical protein
MKKLILLSVLATVAVQLAKKYDFKLEDLKKYIPKLDDLKNLVMPKATA